MVSWLFLMFSGNENCLQTADEWPADRDASITWMLTALKKTAADPVVGDCSFF